MKKALIIIISLAILLLVALWVYLLIVGPTTSPVVEQNTNFGSSPESTFTPSSEENSRGGAVDIVGELTQLTTDPVAGAVIFSRDDEQFVRYVEKGTGHVYEIALRDGATTQITGITIPKVVSATWASTGNRVALEIEKDPYENSVYVAHIAKDDNGEHSLDGTNVEDGAHSLTFDETGDVLFYAVSGERTTSGFTFDLKTEARTKTFEVPLTQVHVLWGDDTYVYSKPSARVRGYVYRVVGNALERIGNTEGFGLMAHAANDFVVVTENNAEGRPESTAYDNTTGSTTSLTLAGYVTKCTPSRSVRSYLWCADTLELPSGIMPDIWLQGATTLNDSLVLVDLRTGDAFLRLDFEKTLGYPLDAIELLVDETDSYVIFKNKTDGTLWLYDATVGRQ